jgi:hypothetical protein
VKWNERARCAFLNACTAELGKHPAKFRTVKAIGVHSEDAAKYAERRFHREGKIPSAWSTMCYFERKLRKQLTRLKRKATLKRRSA